jgi:hypothetical protein
MAAKKPAEPNPTALLRAPPTLPPAPPVLVGLGEEVLEGRTEVGVEMEVGGFVVEEVVVVVVVRVELTMLLLLLPVGKEEVPEGRLAELEETGQLVVEPG